MGTKSLLDKTIKVTIDRKLLMRAQEEGIDLSAALSEKLREVIKQKWQSENKEAIESMNRFHEKYGSFSDELGQI